MYFAKPVISFSDILTSSDKARKKVAEMKSRNRTKLKKKSKPQKIGFISCSDLVVRPYFESTIVTEIFPYLTWRK